MDLEALELAARLTQRLPLLVAETALLVRIERFVNIDLVVQGLRTHDFAAKNKSCK